MKIRLVKKFSSIAKHKPRKLKPSQMRYLAKSWRRSYQKLTPAQKFAIIKTFDELVGALLCAFSMKAAHKPKPSFLPGTVQITDWPEHAQVNRGEFILMPDGSVFEPIHTSLNHLKS